MRYEPASVHIILIQIILVQTNEINMTVELFRNNLNYLEVKDLGISQNRKIALCQTRRFDVTILCVLQGKSTQYNGKNPAVGLD